MSVTEQRFAIADGKATLLFFGHDGEEQFSGMWQLWLDRKIDFDGILIGSGETREEAIASSVDMLLEGVRALRALSPNGSAARPPGEFSTDVIHREP